MRGSFRFVLLAALLFSAPSCGDGDATPAGAKPSTPGSPSAPSTPKDAIAHQLDLLKAGNVDALKACMTERLRDQITQEVVDKGKATAAQHTIDDLVGSVEDGMDGARKTAKIKMKSGRSLTTLIETDGKWLADTIWFK